ncbi:MAG TPA: efflux RND transporter periplasmic adaptor subunit [Vicinamibacterales bacterium]
MPVLTARVEQTSMPVTLPGVGSVEAITSVQIRAQVAGQLSAIHFAEGQDVQKGQPLFSLDPRPFQAAVQQAEAVLARDAATLQNAQDQQGRLDNLFQRGLIARDQYESQRASVGALTGTVAADKAAVENARLSLQYADIRAPMSGRTGALGAHVGDLVRANDTNALVVINQVSPVYVTFSIPGRYLADIRRYQARKPLSVTAVMPSGIDQAAPVSTGSSSSAPPASAAASAPQAASGGASEVAARGIVTFIDNTVDPTTGTIRLKGTFPNSGRQLWPGAFVQVTLDLATDPSALVVPATAVQTSQDGQFVYVVKPDRTVEMRPVRVNRQQGDQVVIAEGVTAGEVVVTDGQLRLTPGARVSERGEAGAGRGPAVNRSGNQADDGGSRRGGR